MKYTYYRKPDKTAGIVGYHVLGLWQDPSEYVLAIAPSEGFLIRTMI